MSDGLYKQLAIGTADEIRKVTMEEANKLPGMLGRLVGPNLQWQGAYACIINGKKVCFLLK